MVVGPVEIEDDILAIGSTPQVYNRTAEFSNRLSIIYKNLQYIFQTKNPVILSASSGTGMMESAVTNTLSKGDTILFVNGGTFGERWGSICLKHGIKTIEIKVPYGKSVDPLRIEEHLKNNSNIKAVLITQNETSTGVLTDVKTIAKIVQKFPNTILIADCISSLVVEKMDMDRWGVDVVVLGSQKALSIPPGLGFMSLSPKAMRFAIKSDLRSFYFDIFNYIKNWERNQTPYTPPIGLLFQLEARLEKIKREGLENIQARYLINTNLIRKGLNELGFTILAKNPANCVSAIFVEDYDASEIVKIMSEKHNISITPSGAALKTKLFRVGNYGDISQSDIQRFLNALKLTLNELIGAK